MNLEDAMRLAKPVSLASGVLALALSALATTGAWAHDDDYGWKRGPHHRHNHHPPPPPPAYVVRERPVYYYSEPRVMYAPPPVSYYSPGPPSLNINIPLR